MHKAEGLICDMDGTIVDTTDLHERVWVALFRSYGIELTPHERQEQCGKRNELFIRLVLGRRGRADLDVARLSAEKDRRVLETLATTRVPIYPGMIGFLVRTIERSIGRVLATSATKEFPGLFMRALLPLFPVVLTAESVKRGKPDPEMLLLGAHKLGLHPSKCVVLGDAPSDIEAAKAGGFFCIIRDNGVGHDLSGADVVVGEWDPEFLITFFR